MQVQVLSTAPNKKKRTREKILSSFCFLQEIISDLKSNDKYITTFNRVCETLGFSTVFDGLIAKMKLTAVEYETLSILMAGFTMLRIGCIKRKSHNDLAQKNEHAKEILHRYF